MKKRHLLNGVLSGVLYLASYATYAAPVSGGSAPGSDSVNGPVAGVKETTEAATANSAVEYWTKARREAAIPREVFADVNMERRSVVAPEQIEEEVPFGGSAPLAPKNRREILHSQSVEPELAIESQAWGTYPFPFARIRTSILRNTYPEKTIGKLFFSIGSTNYVCSASVINTGKTEKRNMLITARHCIFDYPTKTWAKNVVFYPGYEKGANTNLGPQNGWAARLLYTWTSNASDWQYDIGFIQLWNYNRTSCTANKGGEQIGYYTGTLGYKYGGSYDARQFDSFGYPQAPPFNGYYPYQCETSTGYLASFGYTNTLEVGCDMTGGSSGGPWLDTYRLNESGNMNYVTSLNSFRWTSPSRPLSMNGPQFMTGNFYNLYVGAVNLACP